jgi:release factor glutamine methyltransferase
MTYGAALAHGRALLSEAGINTAPLDSRLLLARAAGLDMAALLSRDREEVPDLAYRAFDIHIQRRLRGEPVARILGEKDFWGLPFVVNAATLVPRPETETLVEAVLAEAGHLPTELTICDLGTGSGAIIIALLSELPRAKGVAVDISAEALAAAQANAERLGFGDRIDFVQGDFANMPHGGFDVVTSNPPYIESETIPGLEREVRDYDPWIALDGGSDGLAAYHAILAQAGWLLKPGGLMAFEVGIGQADAVAGLCREAGLRDAQIRADLAAVPRVVSARMPEPLTLDA